jgi:hypothetical protein
MQINPIVGKGVDDDFLALRPAEMPDHKPLVRDLGQRATTAGGKSRSDRRDGVRPLDAQRCHSASARGRELDQSQ